MDVNTTSDKIQGELSRLKTRWFWGITIILVAVLGCSWIQFSRTISTGSPAGGNNAVILEPAPVAGHPAPDFELVNLEGETVRLSDYAGKPVLVNFWATWCIPCRAEFPDFQEAWVDNADNLIIIGVNHTTVDQIEHVDDFVAEMGATFPIVLDEDGQTTVGAYRVQGLPTTVFVDREGIVNEVFIGPINKAYIESKLDEL